MNKYSFVALAVSVTLPGVAMAEMSGSIDLGYSVFSTDGDDIKVPALDVALSYGGETGLLLDIAAGMNKYNADFLPGGVERSYTDFAIGYAFGNGFSAGLFFDNFDLSSDGGPGGINANSKGFFVGYEAGALDGEFYYSQFDLFGSDLDQYGVRGSYSVSEQLRVSAEISTADVDGGEDVKYFGLAANYSLSDNFGIFGGAQKIDSSGADFSSVSLGVSYALGAFSGMDANLALEVARVKQDGAEADVVTLGLSVPLGNAKKSSAPAAGITADIAGGARGPATKLFRDYFLLMGPF